ARKALSAVIGSAVLNRLGHVRGRNAGRTGQVGDRARHLQDAMKTARGQAQATDRLLEQQLALRIRSRVLPHFTGRELSVRFALACELALACSAHPRADRRTWLAFTPPRELFRRHSRHLDVDVDTVEQGAGDAASIARHLIWRAMALAAVVAEITAGAGIHR